MAMTSQRWFVFLVFALATLAEKGLGQGDVHWSFYKTSDGLPELPAHFISFTPRGTLVAAGANARPVSEFDGYSISNFPAPAGLFERVCGSPGGQLWAMAPGQLLEYKNGSWLPHSLSGISTPIQFLPVRQDCVVLLLPDSVVEYSTEDSAHPQSTILCTTAQLQIGAFTGMAFSSDGGLWVCGADGVAKAPGPARNLPPQTAWQKYLPPAALSLGNLKTPEPDEDGGLVLIGESTMNHEKVVATFDGRQWTALPVDTENFSCAWRGPGHSLWAATSESLFQWNGADRSWAEDEELSAGRIYDLAVEPSGAFWLAASDGLVRGAPALWEKPEATRAINSPVESLAADSDGRLYFVADDKLHILENGQHRVFPLPFTPQNSPATYGLFPLANSALLVEAGDKLFHFLREDGSFQSFLTRNEQRLVVLGYLPVGNLCLYLPDANTFEEFNGGQLHRWNDAPPVNDPRDDFTTLFSARNGDIWLGGKSGIFWRHDDKWQAFASPDESAPQAPVGFAEMSDGKICCATLDELWEFDGKNWLLLRIGFNHINVVLASHDGSVWLASNGGLFRFHNDALLDYGQDDGLPGGPVRALCEDPRGQLWAATAHGVALFHPEANPEVPKTFVRSLAGEEARLSEGSTLNLLLEGKDKWKFVPSERLLYSWQLDQGSWSPFQNNNLLSFPGLVAGRHFFQVRALGPEGNLESTPAAFDFTVTLPWFKESRLWVVLFLGAGATIFFAAVAWNRHRQLVLSHAAVEKKVAERTRELEIATRELLHSQKMNALGTLAAGIAHDFNNILSIIKGSAQIIEDNPGQPEKIHLRVERIKTVVQQGAEIVDAMLGFSRASDASAAPCDVNAAVSDTLKLLGDRFLREVEVKFERAEELPEISAPREFIQQILLNFIFNAAEAMNGHKQIILATSAADKLPPDIFLAPASSGPFVLISVQDHGSGIAPGIMSRIFEPFFTTKALSSRRGTGLGLSMVYELAKKMDAGLAVHSTVGQGSTFILILPVPRNGAEKMPNTHSLSPPT